MRIKNIISAIVLGVGLAISLVISKNNSMIAILLVAAFSCFSTAVMYGAIDFLLAKYSPSKKIRKNVVLMELGDRDLFV